MKRSWIYLIFSVFALFGCLERKEKLVIRADGSVQVLWKISGDEEDAKTGIKLPVGAHWKTQESIEEQEQRKTFHYQAEHTYPSLDQYQRDMETCFVAPDLQFTTELSLKTEGSRTFYHFKRLYFARDFWKFEQLRKRCIDEKISKKVEKNGFKELSTQEQKQFLQGLSRFECEKRILWVLDALGKMATQHVFQTALLKQAENQLRAQYETILKVTRIESFFDLMQQLETSKNNKDSEKQKIVEALITRQLEQIEAEFSQAEQTVLQQTFSSLPYPSYLKEVKLSFQLTEDLGDERFEVRLELPGTLLYTNGVRSLNEPNTVFWEFEGKQLQEGHLPFEAISVLEK